MGMFDTIEIVRDVDNGPKAGEFQSKDLDSVMDYYVLDNNRLYKKLIEYELIPEEERKHPIFGIFRSKFLGMKDTGYHGIIEAYSVNETWNLKFTDGDLVECLRTEYIPNDVDAPPYEPNEEDSDGEWGGDNRVYEYEPEEYEG